MPRTVEQDGFEPIEFGTVEIGTFIDQNAGHLLSSSRAHDACLAVADGEAFIENDCQQKNSEPRQAVLQFPSAGKDEVVPFFVREIKWV